MAAEIMWEDPPQKRRGHRPPNPVWAACKANPGRWALLKTGGGLSGDSTRARRAEGFELAFRKGPDAKVRTYVRWDDPDAPAGDALALRCDACAHAVAVNKTAELVAHTRAAHQRDATRAERTPRRAVEAS